MSGLDNAIIAETESLGWSSTVLILSGLVLGR
jgi:hypothetical protein